jgi:hypothetical protein
VLVASCCLGLGDGGGGGHVDRRMRRRRRGGRIGRFDLVSGGLMIRRRCCGGGTGIYGATVVGFGTLFMP